MYILFVFTLSLETGFINFSNQIIYKHKNLLKYYDIIERPIY